MASEAIVIRNVGKSYGATKALSDFSLNIQSGTVHAVLGENGAGKSTLIKIMTGVIAPDTGEVSVLGKAPGSSGVDGSVPLATVFQELSLVPHLSVEDNIFLGRPIRGMFGLIDQKAQRKEARRWLATVGLDNVHPGTHVSDLSLTQRQLLEIAKALAKRPKILLLDEATASLPGTDVDRLFKIIEAEKRDGMTVIYISHRMGEIERISDKCSVLRNGRLIDTFPTGTKSHDEVCTLLAGREISQVFPSRPEVSASGGALALKVTGLNLAGKLHDISFDLRHGEILGIGGLEGQGQKDLLNALYGAVRITSGRVQFQEERFSPKGPRDSVSRKRPLMLLPEDRKSEGLLLPESIEDNILMAVKGKFSRFGIRDKTLERASTAEMIRRLSIKVPSPAAPVSSLSGGNQQKVLLARLLLNEPAIYIFVDPTRGIDVGTKQEIYALMRRLADAGAAIIFLTTDMEELIGMSDRVMIMYGGRISTSLEGDDINEMSILRASLNVDSGAVSGAVH